MSPALKRIVKALGWTLGGIAIIVFVLAVYVQARWDAPYDRPVPDLTAPKDSATVARGEYIFKFQAQCWGCHAGGDPEANSPPSGGLAFDLANAGPGFGIWYSRNITPDPESGIGRWKDGAFVQAIREGVREDRTPLFPLMPVDWYKGMSDDDALAVLAYLRTLPPVAHHVQPDKPSFFAKMLFTFGVIKPQPPISQPVTAPPRAATPEYGKYLAHNLGGCMDCHTPRNLQDGKFYLDSLGAGSTIQYGRPEGDPLFAYASNITSDKKTGIGSWSEEQFLNAITAGMRPDGSVLDAHMPYAYIKSWTTEDLKALYLYIRDLPPITRTAPPPGRSSALSGATGIERGKLLFRGRCQTCHGVNGNGAQPTSVKLAEVVSSLADNDLREFVQDGQLNVKMPAFGKTLRDDELNDIISFMRTWVKN